MFFWNVVPTFMSFLVAGKEVIALKETVVTTMGKRKRGFGSAAKWSSRYYISFWSTRGHWKANRSRSDIEVLEEMEGEKGYEVENWTT